MSRRHLDSASLIAADKLAAELNKGNEALPIGRVGISDARGGRSFSDPGHEHGPSIKCPAIYEALRRKGYDKTKAARISNSKC